MDVQQANNNTTPPLSPRERTAVWLPVLLGLAVGVGLLIGLEMRTKAAQPYTILSNDGVVHKGLDGGAGKLSEILRFIDERYLEDIDISQLEYAAIKGLLHELDPHSFYIPSAKFKEVKESLQGDFEGIGLEFIILSDTMTVTAVIPDGPSDKVGIEVGDKIIAVGDSAMTGTDLNDEAIVNHLKGKKGTKVKVSVLRRGKTTPIEKIIQRDVVMKKSLETAYMLNKKIGYIKLTRFSSKTYKEFMTALEKLIEEGMEDLIIDLRHNSGGYLTEATKILNQLFKEKRLLVYTEGRSYKRKEYKSNGKTFFRVGKIAILVDEGSASASEIMAGAIQDNDRGIIIGRRSFGKGLVQEEYKLSDASALRLTVARYYTPSGRLIQRSYENGIEHYDEGIERRYASGELYYADSIKIQDSTEYKTTGGRIVYGGGGIIPDVFVSIDSILHKPYFRRITQYVIPFVYKYMDQQYLDFDIYINDIDAYVKNYKVAESVLNQYYDYVLSRNSNLSISAEDWTNSKARISLNIKAGIAAQLFGDEGVSKVMAEKDQDIKVALTELEK